MQEIRKRINSFLSSQSLWGSQALRLLDHGELPRELRDVCLQRGAVQSRPGRRNAATRKITRGLARIDAGLEQCLFMGNLDSLRDWGHARDYVEMQWRMLQQEGPQKTS